jgi:RNA polymerase sigma factor (sigma-70 family)
MNKVLQHLRQVMLRSGGAGLTDGQLLDRFIEQREEAALEALVRRHGPLVWSICLRVLGNHHDAEDAFQATFLVLVRRAASVVPREMVANWLYGVASQTARKARATTAKRKSRERLTTQVPEPAVPEPDDGGDLHHQLHQALGRLPTKFRVSIILCDLEGKTRTEAARQLGVPEGTLAAWLSRGRAMLTKRLAGHGLAMTTGVLTVALAQSKASACVPISLLRSTVQAASLLAAEQAAAGIISTPAFALMEGVLREMLATKIKVAATLVLAMGTMVGLGSSGLVYRMHAAEKRLPEQQQVISTNEIRPDDAEFAAAEEEADEDALVGSDKEGKKEIKIADFVALEINLPIHVSATRGDTFRLVISGDDNLLDVVKAAKEGSTLKLTKAKRSWQMKQPLKATITMPALERINLNTACQATIKGFKSNKDFKAKLTGASKLDGSIEAENMSLEATGSSSLKLKGAAKKIILVASGASQIQLEDFALEELKLKADGADRVKVKGSAKKATLSASGASQLQMEDCALDTATVKLSGASWAALHVKTTLNYSLSGASYLHYQGDPKIDKARSSGASFVTRKKR